jgi:hypothetical protein
MHCSGALQRKGLSFGAASQHLTCLSKRVSMTWVNGFQMLFTTTSSGLCLIRTSPRMAVSQRSLFNTPPKFLSYALCLLSRNIRGIQHSCFSRFERPFRWSFRSFFNLINSKLFHQILETSRAAGDSMSAGCNLNLKVDKIIFTFMCFVSMLLSLLWLM